MAKGANFSAPLKVGGTTVVDESGNIIGDITAGAGSIGTAEIANDAITAAKMADNSVDSDMYVDGSIDAAHFAVGVVGTTALAAASVTSSKIDESVIQTLEQEIDATEIVGTDAGDLGHAGGVVLVEASADQIHEFISAVLIYDFDTAAYTGGGDDLVIRQGTTAVSAPVAKADLLADTEDDIAYVGALSAADVRLTANSTINIFAGTAFTQPGTAAGVLRVKLTYRTHDAGLA